MADGVTIATPQTPATAAAVPAPSGDAQPRARRPGMLTQQQRRQRRQGALAAALAAYRTGVYGPGAQP